MISHCDFDLRFSNVVRRKWQSTPVFLPGKSHGQRSLVGYSPWGCKVSDLAECVHAHTHKWLMILITLSCTFVFPLQRNSIQILWLILIGLIGVFFFAIEFCEFLLSVNVIIYWFNLINLLILFTFPKNRSEFHWIFSIVFLVFIYFLLWFLLYPSFW